MINFEAPYTSRNITEFWRRWHISLSSWLRDYLYISLGGNRKGEWKTYRNLFLTMFLGGLWHGAAWTMAIWGVMHGIYLAAHKMILGEKKLDMSWPTTLRGWVVDLVKIVITYHLVAMTWIMFRASSFSNAVDYFQGILRFEDVLDISPVVLFASAVLVTLDIIQNRTGDHAWVINSPRPLKYVMMQVMLVSCLAAAVYHVNTVVPFIYFQF
jgi:D-alanyl-lipoteichoic acid acyltransferase DltB (MBOAT superfamily)